MTHMILARVLSLMSLLVVPAAADGPGAHEARHGKRAELCERLECTDDQKAEIDAIRAEHREDAADERAEAKRLRTMLKVERKKAEPDAEELARVQASLDAIKTSLKQQREASKAEIAALLTPEQSQRLDEMKAERKAERERGSKRKGNDEAKRERGPEGQGKVHAKRERGPDGQGKVHAKRERAPEGKGKAHAKRERGGRDAFLAG